MGCWGRAGREGAAGEFERDTRWEVGGHRSHPDLPAGHLEGVVGIANPRDGRVGGVDDDDEGGLGRPRGVLGPDDDGVGRSTGVVGVPEMTPVEPLSSSPAGNVPDTRMSWPPALADGEAVQSPHLGQWPGYVLHRQVGRLLQPGAVQPARYVARCSNEGAIPSAWSCAEMPSGTLSARTSTRVPRSSAVTFHVIVIVPAKAGSSETKSTA